MDLGGYLQFGVNLGALGTVLWLLARGLLVARSWVTMVIDQANATVEQANESAASAWRAAETADRRADQMVQLMTEQTTALRGVEKLVAELAREHRQAS